MKKIALAAVMAVLMSGAAKADWVDYVMVGGGYSQSPDLSYGASEFEMDYGWNLGILAGWAQSKEIVLAADFQWTQSEYKGFSSDLQAMTLMLDAIYTCDTGDFWHPYIGIGLGGAQIRYDGGNQFPTFSGSDLTFAYQGMAGISFDVDETHAIFVGYRYQAANDVEIENVPNIEYASHSISIGVVFD